VWGMDVKEIFEESRRNSMGVMLSSKDNTGTLTGSTSRTPDIRAPMPQKGASDAPKGYWRPRLPAVVGRHHGPGPSSSAVSVNSSASVTPNISTKTRILAPMNGREGTGVPPLSARLSLKMLGQRHANFSGNAGDDESSSESSSTSGREKEKGGGHNDSDKCILS
jgi:hypothetical protein